MFHYPPLCNERRHTSTYWVSGWHDNWRWRPEFWRRIELLFSHRYVVVAYRRTMLSTLFIAVYVVCLTTAQHTYIYDDENDMRCQDTCGHHIDHLQRQLGQIREEFRQELRKQRLELEALKRAFNHTVKSDDAGLLKRAKSLCLTTWYVKDHMCPYKPSC